MIQKTTDERTRAPRYAPPLRYARSASYSGSALLGADGKSTRVHPSAVCAKATRAILLALVLATCQRQSAVVDRNGDGKVQVLCVGDSNTDPRWGQPKWCELIRARHPEWSVADQGQMYARARGDCILCGSALLGSGIAKTSPDVVLIALGTNDIASTHDSPEAVVDALLTLRAQASAAGVEAFIATVPPVYGDSPEREHVNQQINAANALLARELPANRLIDFHSGMEPDDFEADGVHIKPSGQEKRAAAADRALSGQ